MSEILITCGGVLVMVSMILCGLWLVLRWDWDETQDRKTQDTREEIKNRRIAAELERIRKGGDA